MRQTCPICLGDGKDGSMVTYDCGRCKGTGLITVDPPASERLVFSAGRLIQAGQRPLSGHFHGVNGAWYPCADNDCQWNKGLNQYKPRRVHQESFTDDD